MEKKERKPQWFGKMHGLLIGQTVLFENTPYRVLHIHPTFLRVSLYNGSLPANQATRSNRTVDRRTAILAAVAWRRATR